MTRTLEAQKAFHDKVDRLSDGVREAASQLKATSSEQQKGHTQIGALADQLRYVAEQQRNQAEFSRKVVDDMRTTTEKFGQAAQKADELTSGVAQALEDSFTAFSTQLQNTLNKNLNELDQKLASVLSHLEGNIEQVREEIEVLGDLLSEFNRTHSRRTR
jgi:DNA repair ATPase RecN